MKDLRDLKDFVEGHRLVRRRQERNVESVLFKGRTTWVPR